MASSLSQLFAVVNRRGAAVVVYDATTDQSYLLQPLESAMPAMTDSPATAESVAGLTEEQLLAKINRDIAQWRGEQARRENTPSATVAETDFQFEPADDEPAELIAA